MTDPWERVATEVSEELDRSPTLPGHLVRRWSGVLETTPRDFATAVLALAAARGHAPISGLGVGAVAQEPVSDGLRLHLGANFEIPGAGLGHTVHAEQAAVHNALVAGARSIDRICVGSAPCGRCRQFLLELGPPIELQIQIASEGECEWSGSLADLLPRPFGPEVLGVAAKVFDAPARKGALADPEGRGIERSATEAAARSHAPYGRGLAGAALERDDGTVVAGCLIESVAFNPTLMPLHAALARGAFMGRGRLPRLTRAVLVESTGKVVWAEDSGTALSAIAPGVPLEVLAT